jgi:hypothetical protein
MEKINGYDLSRNWFNFCFENPELISPNHTAIFFFAVEHCNRLGWKRKFGLPTEMAKDAIGIKKHQTYIKYFNDIVDWGFFILIQKSKNQYSSNIISLNAPTKNGKALDKAIIRHGAKQTESIGKSNSPIVKQENKEEPLTINIEFDTFWNLYNKKQGDKKACQEKWLKLKDEEREKIISILPVWVKQFSEKQYQPFPATFLNQKRWNDELPATPKSKAHEASIVGGVDLNDFNIPVADIFGYNKEVLSDHCKQGKYEKK